jgi:hypothetical protein
MLAYEQLRIVPIGLVDKRMTNRVGIEIDTSENSRRGERKIYKEGELTKSILIGSNCIH